MIITNFLLKLEQINQEELKEMKANKYFDIKELVPKEVYEEFGEQKSLDLLDSRALKALEEVREILGIPLICNN